MNERARLMQLVQQYSFTVHETALYLDAYPTDTRALAYHERNRALLASAVADYERLYGPLTAASPQAGGARWSWIDGPWPWEGMD